MKLAIPTDDGLVLTTRFEAAKGFLVITFISGEITEQQLRWNISGDHANLATNITDCDGIMVQEIEDLNRNKLRSDNKEIFNTDDPIITNALMHFISGYLHRESDYCCCP
jgi:hypothetical protein